MVLTTSPARCFGYIVHIPSLLTLVIVPTGKVDNEMAASDSKLPPVPFIPQVGVEQREARIWSVAGIAKYPPVVLSSRLAISFFRDANCILLNAFSKAGTGSKALAVKATKGCQASMKMLLTIVRNDNKASTRSNKRTNLHQTENLDRFHLSWMTISVRTYKPSRYSMAVASLRIFATCVPAEMSCRTFLSSFNGLD